MNKKKMTGITRGVVKKHIRFHDYVKCLVSKEIKRTRMNVIISKLHQVSTAEMNKVALSPNDDKRIILPDGIHTYAHGHYNTNPQPDCDQPTDPLPGA